MDYNVQEGIKKAMNFDGTVDEWVDLVSSLNISKKYESTPDYYFTKNENNGYNMYLLNKKHPIKSGKETKVMICEVVREGNVLKLNASIVVDDMMGNKMKHFSVVFNSGVRPEKFLEEFLDKFKVKKLYVDNVGYSKYLWDYLNWEDYDYSVDSENNVIKQVKLIRELNKLDRTKTVNILDVYGKLLFKSDIDSIINQPILTELKFLTSKLEDDKYYILVSKNK